jgi:phage protein D
VGLGASIRVGMPGVVDADFGAAAHVEVFERIGEATTFSLRLPVVTQNVDLTWLSDARVLPGRVLGVYIAVGAREVCLARGPVTGHAAHLARGVAGSHVDVLGADALVTLDRTFRTRVWENARDSDAVTAIASEVGFAADIAQTNAVHSSELRNLAQADTDLRFLRRLARRNGFAAWLTTDSSTGVDTFHFKPLPLDASPVVTIALNQAGTGTQAVELRWDSERPTHVTAEQFDLKNAQLLSAADTTSPSRALARQRLSDLVQTPQTSRLVAPGDDSAEVKARAEGMAVEAEWFIQASFETTLEATQVVVRSHDVVELAGVGSIHSGSWLVAAVRHLIEPTGHRMAVDLVRNSWGA